MNWYQWFLRWKWWALGGAIAVIPLGGAGYVLSPSRVVPRVSAQEPVSPRPAGIEVSIVHPQFDKMDRTTSQPGSVQAFESVKLYAEVSGYLKTQSVDIGDRIKRGEILATVDVPDLDKQVERCNSILERTRALVSQMEARVTSARADLEAAQAAVPQAEANTRSKAAMLRLREKEYKRYKELAAPPDPSIDERLVDEKAEQRDSAIEAEIAATEGVTSAKARVSACTAKIQAADADVAEARAEVKVAQAELDKARVYVKFATISAPFDGVVTERNFFPNDYVKAASERGISKPLLTVQRTDRMRVVVQVPDRDVPFCKVGNDATVEIDALPGEKFPAKVSRTAQLEDPETRLMRVEIDLPNPTGKIENGMYGRVTIFLVKSSFLTIPSSCIIGKGPDGKGNVYVFRDGRLHLTAVQIVSDNGVQVGIARGLKAEDAVVVHPNNTMTEGMSVVVEAQNVSSGH